MGPNEIEKCHFSRFHKSNVNIHVQNVMCFLRGVTYILFHLCIIAVPPLAMLRNPGSGSTSCGSTSPTTLACGTAWSEASALRETTKCTRREGTRRYQILAPGVAWTRLRVRARVRTLWAQGPGRTTSPSSITQRSRRCATPMWRRCCLVRLSIATVQCRAVPRAHAQRRASLHVCDAV